VPFLSEKERAINDSSWTNRRASEQALRAAEARKVSGRWRFVDPTTCERDYSVAELEFMAEIQGYKQESGRMFPTWSEVLEVLRGLGYEKPVALLEAQKDALPPEAQDDIATFRRTRRAPAVAHD
jgi:hypothetical protein